MKDFENGPTPDMVIEGSDPIWVEFLQNVQRHQRGEGYAPEMGGVEKGIHVRWTPLGFENERAIGIYRAGHWSFALVLPRIIWCGPRWRRKR